MVGDKEFIALGGKDLLSAQQETEPGPAAEGVGDQHQNLALLLTQCTEYLPNEWLIVEPRQLTQSRKKEPYVTKPQQDMEDNNAYLLLHATLPLLGKDPHHYHP